MSNEDEQEKSDEGTLVVEATSSSTLSHSATAPLFEDDAVSTSSGKLLALEEFIVLGTQDCNFNDFIRGILSVFIKIINSEAGSVLEMDHTNQSLFFRAVIGASAKRLIDFNIPVGQGISGHVAESKVASIVDNVPENKIHLKTVEKIIGFETRNLIAIPIIIRGKVYGVVELLNRVGEKNYSGADLEMLTYLSQMAGKIIEIRMMISWASQRGSGYGAK